MGVETRVIVETRVLRIFMNRTNDLCTELLVYLLTWVSGLKNRRKGVSFKL